VFDAVLRDSQLEGVPFRRTEIGQAAITATPANAAALLHCDPGSLVFGAWDSTGLGAGSRPSTKWARALTCEISATRVEPVSLAGNRLDPIGIEGTEQAWVEEMDGTLRQATEDELRPTKDGGLPRRGSAQREYPRLIKASEANHGNSLSLISKGVLVHGDITLNATVKVGQMPLMRYVTFVSIGILFLGALGAQT
jgi:CRISPR-associated protein Csb1